jgi:soluble lytic murein transglycosylase
VTLKLAPIGAAILTLLSGKTCSEAAADLETAPPSVTEESAAPRSPYLDVTASSLLPYPTGTPRAETADRIKEAAEANSRGDFNDAIAALALVMPEETFARDLLLEQRALAQAGNEQYLDAIATLGQIKEESPIWGKALLDRSGWWLHLDDGDSALALLGMTSLPDPQTMRLSTAQLQQAELLRSRALRARSQGEDLKLAYEACKRVWLGSGKDSEAANEADACMSGLRETEGVNNSLNLSEKVQRAQVLGKAHSNKQVIALLQPHEKELKANLAQGDWSGCYGIYELGRAHHKQRDYKKAIPLLGSIAGSCPDEDLTVRSRYLKGQGEGRAGRGEGSIETFLELARLHPLHSYADDGLYNAGKQAQKDGDSERARTLFTQMATRFPEGDMVGKGLWGMAWAHLSQKQPAQAMHWLEQLAVGDPRGRQREYVLMARYWRASAHLADKKNHQKAVQQLSDLSRAEPFHYYGALALWKLHSINPEEASKVSASLADTAQTLRALDGEPESFTPERTFAQDPRLRRATDLLRGGFKAPAARLVAEVLGKKPHSTWEPVTLLYASHLLELAGDPYRSHNLLRKAFGKRHPKADPEELTILRHAFPLAFHKQIRSVTKNYSWDPMVFQGLVREESAFKAAVVSWAGAMGLSQLMWPTAKETARKMGIKGLTREKLNDPELNLRIGSTYFQGLHRRWKGHLPLAVGSYNAGPGAVNRWVKARGDLELDMWVEAIPFDQTRHYVKRVLSSFQTYHFLYGSGDPTIPLRIGAVRESIESKDPKIN